MKLKCIAVDDESMARKLLVENIRQIPFLELVGVCKNPFEAMEVLQQQTVDLMFLDIQMPGMLGTKFLQSLREKPLVIFVTAYSNYAVESYDLEVVDYLMKPVRLERFTKAAYRALELWKAKQGHSSGEIPLAPNVESLPDFFFVNVEYALVRISVPEITHIEAMKDYVKIFLTTQNKPVLTKSTMKSIAEKLPPEQFMRVHKSYLVNLSKIEAIRGNQLTIGDHNIPISETQRSDLLKIIQR